MRGVHSRGMRAIDEPVVGSGELKIVTKIDGMYVPPTLFPLPGFIFGAGGYDEPLNDDEPRRKGDHVDRDYFEVNQVAPGIQFYAEGPDDDYTPRVLLTKAGDLELTMATIKNDGSGAVKLLMRKESADDIKKRLQLAQTEFKFAKQTARTWASDLDDD